MTAKNIYSRKISSKEAQEDFIFILKNKLFLFPELGEKFKLSENDLTKEVAVDSYPCTCRGPERPHEHYFIRWEGLEAKNSVKITKNSEGKYNLHIQR